MNRNLYILNEDDEEEEGADVDVEDGQDDDEMDELQLYAAELPKVRIATRREYAFLFF